MKKKYLLLLLCLPLLVTGCGKVPELQNGQQVVVELNGKQFTAEEFFDELKENYDLIIIDTSSETFLDYTREIINLSNKSIFISGANLLEVRKSERLLEIYKKDWNIEKGKISIVFNKCTKKSLDDTILREIFSNYDILGKIQLSDYYDLVINKNMTEENKLKKEIENIKKQIIKEKYYGVS